MAGDVVLHAEVEALARCIKNAAGGFGVEIVQAGKAQATIRQRIGIHAIVQARSEEHTSELQSLMRISYAVFCLKKKSKHDTHNTYNQNTELHTTCTKQTTKL